MSIERGILNKNKQLKLSDWQSKGSKCLTLCSQKLILSLDLAPVWFRFYVVELKSVVQLFQVSVFNAVL